MSSLVSAVSSKTQFWTYRISTVLKSLKTLYTLPPAKVDAFLNSYVIYDHDWADEKKLIAELGVNYEQEVQKKIVDYYSVLNHLCSIGQVEKMYIPPAMDLSSSLILNQKLFEKMMCEDLGLNSSQKVLDLGCGRGRVASHMSKISGAHVTGLNIDQDQLKSARQYAAANRLNCEFIQGSVNHFPYPFADSSFDNIYQIQCLFSLAKDLGKTFKEIHRLLKPGGQFGSLDWVSLANYNPKNEHHADLMKRVKPLIGAIGTHTIESSVHLLKEAGFEIVKNENASIEGLQAPLIEKADKFFTRVTKLIHFCVRYKVLPAHFKPLFDRLVKDGEAFVEADRMRLFTTSHYIVARKK